MKITKYLIVLLSIILIYSCNKDDGSIEPYDHAGQAVKDKEILQEFLNTHYYTPPILGDHFGKIDTIENGETPLLEQVISEDIEYGDVDYTVYYLNSIEGINASPIKVDSALVNYKGRLLYINKKTENETAIEYEEKKVFDKNTHYTFWANLYGGVIYGWSILLPKFKSGENTSIADAPLSFDQTGKGVIFIPSGLAYRNSATANIPANSPLVFHIELAMTKRSDQDNDGIKSIFEDTDEDNDLTNDDTDSDNTVDFLDADDDNDRLLTKYEYADPNGDGNPEDAVDTDNDGIPDYLDN